MALRGGTGMLVRHSEAKMVANGYVVNPSIIANVGFCKRGALLRHGVLSVVVDVRRASSRVGTRPDGSLQGNVAR